MPSPLETASPIITDHCPLAAAGAISEADGLPLLPALLLLAVVLLLLLLLLLPFALVLVILLALLSEASDLPLDSVLLLLVVLSFLPFAVLLRAGVVASAVRGVVCSHTKVFVHVALDAPEEAG